MAFVTIPSHRMPIDIDGTEIAYRGGAYNDGVALWCNSTKKGQLNDEISVDTVEWTSEGVALIVWVFFPEAREVEQMYIGGSAYYYSTTFGELQGSADSTNGVDGTWETATWPNGVAYYHNPDGTKWRTGVKPVSFSGPMKVLRFRITTIYAARLRDLHIYGRKKATETPDDVVFTDVNGTPITMLMDVGDRPEGTTVVQSIKIQNTSTTKIANNVNLQLNHPDFLLAFSEDGPWSSTLDIASIGVGSLSSTVYIKNPLGPPLLVLGPKAARLIAAVGSWT